MSVVPGMGGGKRGHPLPTIYKFPENRVFPDLAPSLPLGATD